MFRNFIFIYLTNIYNTLFKIIPIIYYIIINNIYNIYTFYLYINIYIYIRFLPCIYTYQSVGMPWKLLEESLMLEEIIKIFFG